MSGQRVACLAALAMCVSRPARSAEPDITVNALRFDAAVVGEITEWDDETLDGPDGPQPIRVAHIRVVESIFGADGLTQLRVVVPVPPRKVAAPAGADWPRKGCYFLGRSADDSWTFAANLAPLDAAGPLYADGLKQTRNAGLFRVRTLKGLADVDPAERFRSLELILKSHHADFGGKRDYVPAGADLSRKIVEAALTLPWSKAGETATLNRLFHLIEPERHGFRPAHGQNSAEEEAAYGRAAKEWLAANLKTIRLRKLAS